MINNIINRLILYIFFFFFDFIINFDIFYDLYKCYIKKQSVYNTPRYYTNFRNFFFEVFMYNTQVFWTRFMGRVLYYRGYFNQPFTVKVSKEKLEEHTGRLQRSWKGETII